MLWNDGKYIFWKHFIKLADNELKLQLKRVVKITPRHVNLDPCSIMNVSLATQVLSETVANILLNYYPSETHATAALCRNMDKFFDCLNVRNQFEGHLKRKPFQEPYREINDVRFTWLHSFLEYLAEWKANTLTRPGNFALIDRNKMFLSRETYEGLQITTLSVIEVTQYLLSEGMPFVLTERFNQDVVEEYFGRHRSLGRRNDNPNAYEFGYNCNTLRIQRSVAPVTGNTRGAHKQKRKVSWSTVSNEPIKKRHRKF